MHLSLRTSRLCKYYWDSDSLTRSSHRKSDIGKAPLNGSESSRQTFVILDLQERPIGGVFLNELEALYAVDAFFLTKPLEALLSARLHRL